MSTDSKRRSANRLRLAEFLEVVGDRNFANLRALCREDFVCELPYADPPLRLEGIDAYLAHVEPALETFRFRLTLDRIHEGLDPDLLIAEYTSDGSVLTTGKPYRNVYIGVWRFDRGRIAALREFYDPLIAARALEPDRDSQLA